MSECWWQHIASIGERVHLPCSKRLSSGVYYCVANVYTSTVAFKGTSEGFPFAWEEAFRGNLNLIPPVIVSHLIHIVYFSLHDTICLNCSSTSSLCLSGFPKPSGLSCKAWREWSYCSLYPSLMRPILLCHPAENVRVNKKRKSSKWFLPPLVDRTSTTQMSVRAIITGWTAQKVR